MITVVGGKLTTYRAMAREVVDRAMRELRFREGRPPAPRPRTDEEPLPGGEAADLTTFRDRGLEIGVLPESVEHLLRHYGTEAAGIYNLGGGDRRLLRRLLPPHPAIEAEVLHAVRRELAQTVEDVLVRRLHLYYEHPERGIPAAAAGGGADGHGRRRWDEARIEQEADATRSLPAGRRACHRACPPQGRGGNTVTVPDMPTPLGPPCAEQ